MQIQSFNHLSAGAFSSPCIFQCGKVQFQVMSVHLRSQEPHLAIPEHEHPVFELSTNMSPREYRAHYGEEKS